MAVFNPQVNPINAPHFDSGRPISDIQADKSKALAISTVAEGIDTGVKVAESIDEDIIKNKVRAGVETIRDTTTAAYENVRTSLLTGQNPDPRAANVAGLSLMKATQQSVPDSLQNGIDRAEDIAIARSQGNLRANDTLYTSALNSLAKQLRAEYPGHKDFIDQQMERISGKNAANAYMDNLLQDVSRLAAGTDNVEKKIVNKAISEWMGDPAVNIALRKYQAKMPGGLDDLYKAISDAEADKLAHQKAMNGFQENEAAGKQDTGIVRYQAQQSAQKTVFRNFNAVVDSVLDAPTITKLINESREGKISSVTPQQWEGLAQAMERMRDTTLDQIKYNFNNLGISRRLASGGNTEDEKKIIDNEIQFFDRSIAAIRDPNKGLFFEMQRRSKGLTDQAGYQALSDPNIGPFLQRSKVLQDYAGPNWTNFVTQWGLEKNYQGKMKNWFNDVTMNAGIPDDIRKDGKAKSVTFDVQTAKQQQDNGVKFDPRLYDDLVKNVDLIDKAQSMGKTDVAKELVKYMYDPTKNSNFVNLWSRDTATTKGYFTYYNMLSAPKVVDGIWNLKDPEAWNMHRVWQENNFRKLFGKEIQTLNQNAGGVKFTIEWNSDTHQMTPKFELPDPQYRTAADTRQAQFIAEDIAKLNEGLKNIGYMYNKENTEPNEGIFTMLMQLNYKPDARLSGSSLPQKVIDAINTSQFQPSPEERLQGAFKRMGR